MKIDIDFYKKAYFYFDKPVDYQIQDKLIKIHPVAVEDSEVFLSSMNILMVDKNSSPSVEIIQMSYLEFIYKVLFQDQTNIDRFVNILKYCLHINSPYIGFDENNKPYLVDKENDILIGPKDFENIKRLILYQNLIHYDDEYINPELKAAMSEVDELRNKGIDSPTIERRIAIVTAHCGLSKKEQLKMTYRSHSLLFEEVYGEVEYTTLRPIALFGGNGDKIDNWIYKKKKDKFEGYVTDADKYSASMGGQYNAIQSTNTNRGDIVSQQYEQFVNK